MGYLFMLGCIGIYTIFLVMAASKADKEYIQALEIERRKQAEKDIKIGCIKQSMEKPKKAYKPLKCKKNKLRRKAINAYKNHNKEIINLYGEGVSFRDVAIDIRFWSRMGDNLSYPNIKAIVKYLRSLEREGK